MKKKSSILKSIFGVLFFLFCNFCITVWCGRLIDNYPFGEFPNFFTFILYIILNIGLIIWYTKKEIIWLRRTHWCYIFALVIFLVAADIAIYYDDCVVWGYRIFDYTRWIYGIGVFINWFIIVGTEGIHDVISGILFGYPINIVKEVRLILLLVFVCLMGVVTFICDRTFTPKKQKAHEDKKHVA